MLGITGASGVVYGVRLAEELARSEVELTVIVSDAARKVLATEMPEGVAVLEKCGPVLGEGEVQADIASGSAKFDATVICPCSMKTLAAIANGYANNLITRNADVALKEHRRLVLVVRETPLKRNSFGEYAQTLKVGRYSDARQSGFLSQSQDHQRPRKPHRREGNGCGWRRVEPL